MRASRKVYGSNSFFRSYIKILYHQEDLNHFSFLVIYLLIYPHFKLIVFGLLKAIVNACMISSIKINYDTELKLQNINIGLGLTQTQLFSL